MLPFQCNTESDTDLEEEVRPLISLAESQGDAVCSVEWCLKRILQFQEQTHQRRKRCKKKTNQRKIEKETD